MKNRFFKYLMLLVSVQGFMFCVCNQTRAQNIITVAGDSTRAFGGDGGLAVNAKLNIDYMFTSLPPNASYTVTGAYMALDDSGNIYFDDKSNYRIRKISATTHVITTVIGDGIQHITGNDGPASVAGVSNIYGICLDHSQNIYFIDGFSIRKITASTGIVSSVGTFTDLSDLAVDDAGNIYYAEVYKYQIRKIDAVTKAISIIAGTGPFGYSGNGGPATSAQLSAIMGVALDKAGNVYFAEYGLHHIRKITMSTGIISLVAGKGTGNNNIAPYDGDGGLAINADISRPQGLTVDSSGNVYIADTYNNAIRKVDATTGIITTIAGTGYGHGGLNTGKFYGECVPAVTADLNSPTDVAVDKNGNVFILDMNNNRIREITNTSIGGNPLTVVPAAATICDAKSITLSVSGGSGYTWSPSRGLNTTLGNTVIATVSSTTTFTVQSGSGCSASEQQVVITIGGKETAGTITAVRDTICSGTTANLMLSGNSSDSIIWQSSIVSGNFNGVVEKDTTQYRTLPLTQSTYYRVLVGSGVCLDTSVAIQLIVPPQLTASFSTVNTGRQVSFTSTSVGAVTSYYWDFGDGQTSTEANPVHTFSKDSTYNVCLTIYDGSNCSYTFCRNQEVKANGVAELSDGANINIYPNPFTDKLYINVNRIEARVKKVEIYDVLGKSILSESVDMAKTGSIEINGDVLVKGVYFLRLQTENDNYMQKLVKQ